MSKDVHNISSHVMSKIKNGSLQMRPKLYFSLLSGLSLTAGIAAGLLTAYLSSVMFYWFKLANLNARAYGLRRNFNELIASFPWWALVLDAIIIAVVVYMVRRYGSMYRHKLRYVLLAIIVIALIAGFLLSILGVGDIRFFHGYGQGPYFNR